VWTTALVDHGGFPLQVAIHWSRSSFRTPAVCFIISWQLSTSIGLYSHPIACCFLFLQLPILRTILNCVSWVIFLVAGCAELRWTKWCLLLRSRYGLSIYTSKYTRIHKYLVTLCRSSYRNPFMCICRQSVSVVCIDRKHTKDKYVSSYQRVLNE